MMGIPYVAYAVILAVTGAAAAEPEPVTSKTVYDGNTAFAVDLYHRLADDAPGNLFFSPLSLSSALAMTYAGARGETAQQMAEVLHFPPEQEPLHRTFAALTREFNAESEDYELSVANALWGQKDFEFLKPFVKTLDAYYGAGLNHVDFAADPESVRDRINGWVEDQTGGKIQNLIGPGMLDALTRLVLTNAVYFKGLWAEQFKTSDTRDEPFYLTGDETVTAPLMHITHKFGYVEKDQFLALEMPYKGHTLSMVVLLPKEKDGLAAFEESLTPETLAECVTSLREQDVVVAIPRFKMTSEFQLQKVLAEMGMPLAFSGAADFSGMTGKPDLFISAVLHKAFVDVNEEGTEAAAATGVIMKLTAVAAPSSPPVFRADHPFAFLIRDRQSGSILFMGRVVDPRP